MRVPILQVITPCQPFERHGILSRARTYVLVGLGVTLCYSCVSFVTHTLMGMTDEFATDTSAQRWFSGSERSVSTSFDDRETSDSRSLCVAVARAMVRQEPRHVLDIGCGTGEMTALAATAWPQASVVGIDPLPQAVDEARRKHLHDNLSFAVAAAEDLGPDRFEPVDLILCHLNLGLWGDPERGLMAAARLLAPGGLCYVVDLAAPTAEQLPELLEMARTSDEREYLAQQFAQALSITQAQSMAQRMHELDPQLTARVGQGGLAGFPFTDPQAAELWSHPAVREAISAMDTAQQSAAKVQNVLYWEIRRAP